MGIVSIPFVLPGSTIDKEFNQLKIILKKKIMGKQKSVLKIKEAVLLYNRNRKPDTDKMTQERLAEIVVDSDSPTYRNHIMSCWTNGEKMSALKPEHITKICKTLGVDANFLLEINPVKAK